MSVSPLEGVPEIVEVEPPVLPRALSRRAAAIRDELLSAPGGYDDPVLVCLEADRERTVVYRAPYSLGLAVYESEQPQLGTGALAVKLLLRGPSGRLLWQQRSERVLMPGLWDWSATGAVDPGEDVWAAVVREAEEELGLRAIESLEPLALLNGRGCAVLFQGVLLDEEALSPDAAEVAALVWGPEPPEGRTPSLTTAWPQVKRLLR